MLTRRGFLAGAAGVVLLGRRPEWLALKPATPITIYKSKSCGCCTKWVEYLTSEGFEPRVHDEEAMDQLKDELGVPQPVRSCHTAIVGTYLIEGHVPASDIRRLLAERPKAAGLAAPGMPPRSPGMAPAGSPIGGYDVLLFQSDGSSRVFTHH
jgi:hypothetical protein